MRWRKERIPNNEGKLIDAWRSKCGTYLYCLNVNIGLPEKGRGRNVDKNGHQWLFELWKTNHRGEEESLGTAPTVDGIRAIAECDEEGL